ncbi:hypothetical protein [uncultured Oscillibacter sp.]|uniref:hypothetical protein n=1 Tax=uncultured Oscillibacter sp. TaxID=876091 RepID=UPI0025E6145B|nr:hypothetical protein [uncultured Oscillibacter sp.]
MKLSTVLKEIGHLDMLVRDGEFSILEQCTRIRGAYALTYLEKEKFAASLEDPDITCVICTPETVNSIPGHIQGLAVTRTPKLLFFKIHGLLVSRRERRPTVIDPSARVSPQAYVAPYNVTIGKDVEIQPFAAIGENTTIEDGVRICFGTLVGSQGFTSVRDGETMFLAADAGKTLIRQGAEICGHCDIACGLLEMDTTIIGAYSKLDAKVHIGHGAVLGERVLIPSGAHVAGNCIIGDDVWIGVNATISNRIVIGDGARVSLGSVVTKDVPAGETVTGNFAIPHRAFLRNLKASLAEKTYAEQMPPPRGLSEDP